MDIESKKSVHHLFVETTKNKKQFSSDVHRDIVKPADIIKS
jgi:hypothetical protein